jgi:hypothetical protein
MNLRFNRAFRLVHATEYFRALGLVFDLDPCSPGPDHWMPAKRIYTKADDGLP